MLDFAAVKYCDACRTPYPADYTTCPKDRTEAILVLDPDNPKASGALEGLREHAPPPR